MMALIKAKKNREDTVTIRANTGFGGQKVTVWELSKKGRIKRVDRGLYWVIRRLGRSPTGPWGRILQNVLSGVNRETVKNMSNSLLAL